MSLTMHIQRIPECLPEFVERCDGRLETIVGVDCFPDYRSAGVATIGRTWVPNDAYYVNKGKAGADEWIDRFAPVYHANPHVEHWIPANEFILDCQDGVDRFNEFHIQYITRMWGLGHKVAAGQINTGWMRLRKYGNPPPYPESIAPMLTALWAHKGIFTTHEYWPGLNDPTGNILRYRDFRAALLEAGVSNLPPMFISELGVDLETTDPGSDYGHWGWRKFMDWPTYLGLLKSYNSEISKDPYVLGASIFTEGGGWESFELNQEQVLELADYIAQEVPKPEIVYAKLFDASEFQGDINWPLVKSDEYVGVLLRASGANGDRTEMRKDPRFDYNYAGAGSEKLHRGAYHGLHPDFPKQALLFAQSVNGRPLELGWWSDIEYMELTDEKCNDHLNAMDARIAESYGLPPSKYADVYTNLNFMNHHDGYWAEGRKLWIGAWVSSPNIQPIIPEPWTRHTFHQWTCDGSVPGVPKRTCLDVYNGTEGQFYEEFGKLDNGEEKMVPKVVDKHGTEIMTLEEANAGFGIDYVRADPPEGATVWRLREFVLDDSPDTNWRLYTHDANGAPLSKIACFMGIHPPSGKDLDDDQAPRLSETFWGQPGSRPNRADVHEDNAYNWTNADGYIQRSLGRGSNYVLPGPTDAHWGWIMPGDNKEYSDVAIHIGMWENHKMFWLRFYKEVEGENGNGNGEDSEIVVQLKRLADAAEHLVEKGIQIRT
ncbi:MAG: hypothetical protein GWN93_06055 [Deltaproteobacteria bacterium]|nr:hypothetical protein [Deltaproteobacteria bacterium]